MNAKKIFFAIFLGLSVIGCSSKVEGEAFVVTKGGESKKLGLVDIRAYKVENVDQVRRLIVSEYSEYIDKLAEDYKFEGLKDQYELRKILLTEIQSAEKKFYKCSYAYGIQLGCESRIPKELQSDFDRRANEIKSRTAEIISAKAVKLDEKFDLLFVTDRIAHHTKNLEPTKTRTDSDGRFSLVLPRGEHLIVGVGIRQSLGEDYLWLQRVSSTTTLRMANDSFFDQGCESCLLTKDDLQSLKEKKKKLQVFVGANNGGMMLYVGGKGETGIHSQFWTYMCGGGYMNPGGRVFDWAECVK